MFLAIFEAQRPEELMNASRNELIPKRHKTFLVKRKDFSINGLKIFYLAMEFMTSMDEIPV